MARDAGTRLQHALAPARSASRRRGFVLSLALAAALGMGACGSEDASSRIGSDRWGAYDVVVESRPAPPRAGNNEVVVVVTGERHQPVYDAVVFVRTSGVSDWTQAIEDGHVGVYRRAVNFGHGGAITLEVQLKRGTEEAVLSFPVTLAASQ
jgi:hypothetical protein